MYKKHISLLMLGIILSISSFVQAQNVNPNQSFAKGEFTECVKICDEILKSDSNDKAANFFKGASLVRLKKYKEAKEFLAKAEQNEYQPKVAVNANLMRAYAGLQETESLIKLLKKLADNGFRGLFVFNNEEFNYLENNEEFNQLKKRIDANANPCKYGTQYQRLDFWLGEWDVYVNEGKIGTSSITKSEGGCSLYEDYKTFTGFLGRSTNYYDPADSLYTQIWIDKFNGIIIFKEVESKEGYLQMLADDGAGSLTRMTYVQDATLDNVTQRMEGSTDKGKTWAISFVGVYKRKNETTKSQEDKEP